MGNTGPILSGHIMTPQFLMCSMLLNILTVLANFPGFIIEFSQKTSVATVATLFGGPTERGGLHHDRIGVWNDIRRCAPS